MILLARHLVSVITEEPNHYAFTLITVSSPGFSENCFKVGTFAALLTSPPSLLLPPQVFVLRASGILLPFYVIMSAIKAIQYSQRHQLLLQRLHVCSPSSLRTIPRFSYRIAAFLTPPPRLLQEGNGGPLQRGPREDELLQHHVIQIHS